MTKTTKPKRGGKGAKAAKPPSASAGAAAAESNAASPGRANHSHRERRGSDPTHAQQPEAPVAMPAEPPVEPTRSELPAGQTTAPAPAMDIFWSASSIPTETEVSEQTTWLARCEEFQGKQAKIVLTVPRFDGAGRPRFVPMILNNEGGWIALECDRHGHCRGYQSLAKAIDEIETFWRTRTGRSALTTNAAEIVLAAEQNGIAHITEEIEDMAKKTRTETVAKPKTAKSAKKGAAKAGKATKGDGKLSAIDAAAKVLTEAGQAMNCQEMIKAMADKGYWTSPGGKTPAATLYSAILRELKAKGNDARFKKTERGKFGVGRAS